MQRLLLFPTPCRWDSSRVLLDPYAPLVSGRRRFGKRDAIENFQGKVGHGVRRWVVW